MNVIIDLISDYIPYIIVTIIFLIILMFLLCLVLMIRLKKLKKRYDFFMGKGRRPEHSLEVQLQQYKETVNDVASKYEEVVNIINDVRSNLNVCTQKIGIVRYNPFEEMGGNLSFAIAVLDREDNGFVLNGIHSRTGTFTYAKPVEFGVSTYVLCDEEIQAIEEAKSSSYKVMEKEIKIEKKIKIYKIKAAAMDKALKKDKYTDLDKEFQKGEIQSNDMILSKEEIEKSEEKILSDLKVEENMTPNQQSEEKLDTYEKMILVESDNESCEEITKIMKPVVETDLNNLDAETEYKPSENDKNKFVDNTKLNQQKKEQTEIDALKEIIMGSILVDNEKKD